MDGRWIGLLALAPMALVAIAIGARTKAHYLEELQLEPGEQTLWDEDRCRASLRIPSRRSTAIYPGARVRLTDRRLIVAQKVLFAKKHLVRVVCLYCGEVPELDRKEGLFKAHQNYRLKELRVDGDKLIASLKPELDNPQLYEAELTLRTPRATEYAAKLRA
jgi:hypothetical protein